MDSAVLFIPAGDERKLRKIADLPPCALVFDCEDAIAVDQKEAARSAIAASLGAARAAGRDALVRINALESPWWQADAQAAIAAGAGMLLVPKAQDPAALATLDTVLAAAERAAGHEAGATRIIALIETAAGCVAMREVLAAPRVDAAMLGLADLALDLGTAWDDAVLESPQLFVAERTALSLCSRALRKAPPWDAVFLALDREDAYAADVRLGRRLGCQGKFVIHPAQIAAVRAEYTVSAAERERAQAIVDAYARAVREGRGAISLDGMMIDEPVVAQARVTLARSAPE